MPYVKKYNRCFVLAVFALISLSACLGSSSTSSSQIITQEPLFATAAETAVIREAGPIQIATPTPSAVTELPIIPSVQLTSTPLPVFPNDELFRHNKCPVLIASEQPHLWSEGSILFSRGELFQDNVDPYEPDTPGIWAISTSEVDPHLAYDVSVDQSSWAYVSTSGSMLLRFNRVRNGRSEDVAAILYNLTNGKELSIPVPNDPISAPEWLPDGRLRYIAEIERIEGRGETRKIIVLDPSTGQSQAFLQGLDLPSYAIDRFEVLPSGYSAVDPTGELILFTSNIDRWIDVFLIRLDGGDIIWRGQSEGLPIAPTQAIWSADGENVLFVLNVAKSEGGYRKIVSLSRSGQLESLPGQPYPELDEMGVRYLTRSPDGRYIVYGLWESARRGRGFVVDTVEGKVGEICRLGTTFLDGKWLPNGQFVYRDLIQDGEKQKHSLQILDIPTWTTQILYETEPGFGINIFGWTPIEFP